MNLQNICRIKETSEALESKAGVWNHGERIPDEGKKTLIL
jgi:hypothetical protein